MSTQGLTRVAALLAVLLWSTAGGAQSYPIKPVRIIVPYQAGQGTDVAARYQVVAFKSPADTPAMPGMLRRSAAFAPRYRKFESISLQQRVVRTFGS